MGEIIMKVICVGLGLTWVGLFTEIIVSVFKKRKKEHPWK